MVALLDDLANGKIHSTIPRPEIERPEIERRSPAA
jgi:hypothetical protein